MKVLIGPTNFANQPSLLARALKDNGVDVTRIEYAWNNHNRLLRSPGEEVVDLTREDWLQKQFDVLRRCVDEGHDIFHFWHRSLVYNPGSYGFFSGLDLPLIKAAGGRIIYRFTGYDLRRPSLDKEVNLFSPLHAPGRQVYSEEEQQLYIDYLHQWVDRFVVQDPEMGTFMPAATVVPRGLDLSAFSYVGVSETSRPLVVHAPSDPELKGTEHVLAAVERLRDRGMRFDFKLIQSMPHAEAQEWYKKADIVIDQVLIGWYGVLTVEALALGKPVLAYVRDDLYESFSPRMPIVNANPETLTERLAELIADSRLRRQLGEAGREFAEQVHDIKKIAEQMTDVYAGVLSSQPVQPEHPVHRFHSDLAGGIPKALLDSRRFAAIEGGLPQLRSDARRWQTLKDDLPELQIKARKWDAIAENLSTLRLKARNWDVVQEGLPSLRAKAKYWEAAQEELKVLRLKAKNLDAVQEGLPVLRMKAKNWDAVQESLPVLRTKAKNWEAAQEELPGLRAKAKYWEAAQEELKALRLRVKSLDAFQEDLPELRRNARNRSQVSAELPSLRYKAGQHDVLKAEVLSLRAKLVGKTALSVADKPEAPSGQNHGKSAGE